MAELSKAQLDEVIARVIGDVTEEVAGHERAFGVADLGTRLADLAKVGGESAWTISYSTSSAFVEKGLPSVQGQ
jgi:hypothetical protein